MNGTSKAAIGGVLAIAALGIGAGVASAVGPPEQAGDQAPDVCVASTAGAIVQLDGGTVHGNVPFPGKFFCR